MAFNYGSSFGNQYPLMGGANAQFEQPQISPQINYSQPYPVNPTSIVFNREAAEAADPFAPQRMQYQQQLSALMGGIGSNQTQNDITQALQMAQGGGAANNPYMKMLNNLMTNPSSITAMPGTQYAESQATNAVQRQMAAQGLGGSGNILAEIGKQTQGIAQQDYNQQVENLLKSAGLYGQEEAQKFSEVAGVAGLQQQQQNSIMNTLTTLSGANQGSPAAAGGFISSIMGGGGGSRGSGNYGGSTTGIQGGLTQAPVNYGQLQLGSHPGMTDQEYANFLAFGNEAGGPATPPAGYGVLSRGGNLNSDKVFENPSSTGLTS